jgi:hypothetical protein
MMLHRAVIRIAALLVPAAERAAWLDEWQSELWYVRDGATGFCLGAFRNALWVRRNNAGLRPPLFRIVPPWRCLAALTVLAAVSVWFAFCLPLPRSVLLPSALPHADRLAVISEIDVERYRRLSRDPASPFTALAFYRTVRTPSGRAALASANLSEVLGVTIGAAALRELPGRVHTLLVQDESPAAGTKGFAMGRLRAAELRRNWTMTIGGESFACSSLAHDRFLPGFAMVGLLSLLIVAMTAPLHLGEYPASHSWRRWGFLAAKLVLVQIIACCGSLDLASISQPGFQPHGLLIGLILCSRWALADQRQRCPDCLRLLSTPTRIGGASRVFLDWYGTEFICPHGHGLLYVPEIPTSSYSTQRWQSLDDSWSTLFAK